MYHEKVHVVNYGVKPLECNVKFLYNADFHDIFEVKGYKRKARSTDIEKSKDHAVEIKYRGLDKKIRCTRFHVNPVPEYFTVEELQYNLNLMPRERFNIELNISFEENHSTPEVITYNQAEEKLHHTVEDYKRNRCDIHTSNEQFNEWINRSNADLMTLLTMTDYGFYPYAGIPWYSTPFGRDGIITAWMALWKEPEITRGVLRFLAQTQADKLDASRDAEPGKIFHEIRRGEMAELGEVPFKKYFGTIDATLCLFV